MIVGDSTSRALQFPQAPADVFIEATAVELSFIGYYAFDVSLTLTGANAADIAADNDASVVLYSDYAGYQTFPFEGCLLYTSPSPRDRTRSRMPSSA